MSEDADRESKTEEATPKRVNDAIEKGNTPFSREVGSFAAILAIAMAVSFAAEPLGLRGIATLERFIERPDDFRIEVTEDALQLLTELLLQLSYAVIPITLVIMVVGVASGLSQNAPRLVGHRIAPDPSRLSPKKGFERIFGPQGRFELLKSIAKLVIMAGVTLYVLSDYQSLTFNTYTSDPRNLPTVLNGLVTVLLYTLAGVLAVLAFVDFLWSRYKWTVDLRMTKQEVQDEMKQVEGDPMVKARQRSLARDRARRRMIAAVPQATVVITNPTHIAVALRYNRGEDAAPVVIAKGADIIALKIREIATESNVPIVENKPLARALYKSVNVDQPILPEFYQAVAEIITHLMAKKIRH